MAISNEQQNLLDNLRAPIKSFRIFALEEVIRAGDSPEILSVLEEISVYEDDPECSMLITHAISAVKERLEGAKKPEQIQITDAASLLSIWHDADENMRMHILSNLPARLPKDVKVLGPDLLENSSPVVAARVIRAFCRNWPEEKFVLISEKLYSDSLVLKLAALRTMVHMNPEQLLPDLPALLASNDPEIKALAIRGLVKIDKEEALNHLQALLLSPTQTERLAGIQNCPLLPFEIVKPLLLKYFAAETNSEFLTKAGWIIEMNPDVEVPFTLFEIAERSPAKKADLVKKVLNEAVRLLEKSGILGDQFAAYTKKLQAWVNKRNALRYVKQIVARLDSETVSAEINKSVIVALKQPVVATAFKEALLWPVSDLVKSRIASYLGIETAASDNKNVVKQNEKQSETKPSGLSQLEILATFTPEKALEKLEQLLLMLSHKDTDVSVKIAVFQCLTRCRISGAESVAVKYIKHNEISLATAAVEYLGIVDPDQIFPYLGQCLKVADIGMKSAALGILKNFDYNQAISSLKAMLYSPQPNQQKMALECMNQFDFALVRDMLTEYLCHDYSEAILEAGLLHFAANPSADNVYSLYKIEQAHTGKIAEQAKQLREACPVPTEEMAVATETAEVDEKDEQAIAAEKANAEEEKKKKEEELKERLRVEKEKQKSKKPAYAYRSPADQPEVTSKQQLKAIWIILKNFVASKALPISIVVFLLVAGGFYILFVPKGNGPAEAKGGAVVADKSTIEGEVKRINNNLVIMIATNGETILMTPIADGFNMPKVGTLLRVSIIPYRQTKEGYRVVKIRGMRVINEYSQEFGKEKAK